MINIEDMNDPEVIESLKYLAISKEERIKLSELPFDVNKNCFIAHKTEGYVTAIIEGEFGEFVTVRTCKEGKVIYLMENYGKNFEKKCLILLRWSQ